MLRAVLLSGVGVALVGLFGLGLGAVIRHSAAALAVYAGAVFVVGELLVALSPSAVRYIPLAIVGDSLAVSRVGADALSPWTGLAVLCLYAAVRLVAGGRLFTPPRRLNACPGWSRRVRSADPASADPPGTQGVSSGEATAV